MIDQRMSYLKSKILDDTRANVKFKRFIYLPKDFREIPVAGNRVLLVHAIKEEVIYLFITIFSLYINPVRLEYEMKCIILGGCKKLKNGQRGQNVRGEENAGANIYEE